MRCRHCQGLFHRRCCRDHAHARSDNKGKPVLSQSLVTMSTGLLCCVQAVAVRYPEKTFHATENVVQTCDVLVVAMFIEIHARTGRSPLITSTLLLSGVQAAAVRFLRITFHAMEDVVQNCAVQVAALFMGMHARTGIRL